MYTYMYTYIYTHIYTHIYIYIYIHVYMYMYRERGFMGLGSGVRLAWSGVPPYALAQLPAPDPDRSLATP